MMTMQIQQMTWTRQQKKSKYIEPHDQLIKDIDIYLKSLQFTLKAFFKNQ